VKFYDNIFAYTICLQKVSPFTNRWTQRWRGSEGIGLLLLLLLILLLLLLLFSTYALQLSKLIVRSGLEVPTFATRHVHACYHAIAPSGGRWNCGREMLGILPKCQLPRYIQGSFTCRKATTWDQRLYFPSEGRRAEDFFALKIRRLRSGANPLSLASTLPLDHRSRLQEVTATM
jgi:hypothetical protein